MVAKKAAICIEGFDSLKNCAAALHTTSELTPSELTPSSWYAGRYRREGARRQSGKAPQVSARERPQGRAVSVRGRSGGLWVRDGREHRSPGGLRAGCNEAAFRTALSIAIEAGAPTVSGFIPGMSEAAVNVDRAEAKNHVPDAEYDGQGVWGLAPIHAAESRFHVRRSCQMFPVPGEPVAIDRNILLYIQCFRRKKIRVNAVCPGPIDTPRYCACSLPGQTSSRPEAPPKNSSYAADKSARQARRGCQRGFVPVVG
jgi:hypothetical protein